MASTRACRDSSDTRAHLRPLGALAPAVQVRRHTGRSLLHVMARPFTACLAPHTNKGTAPRVTGAVPGSIHLVIALMDAATYGWGCMASTLLLGASLWQMGVACSRPLRGSR